MSESNELLEKDLADKNLELDNIKKDLTDKDLKVNDVENDLKIINDKLIKELDKLRNENAELNKDYLSLLAKIKNDHKNYENMRLKIKSDSHITALQGFVTLKELLLNSNGCEETLNRLNDYLESNFLNYNINIIKVNTGDIFNLTYHKIIEVVNTTDIKLNNTVGIVYNDCYTTTVDNKEVIIMPAAITVLRNL